MREIQLYVEDQRLDLFSDENIDMKSSIQDAKDISKVFTDYTSQFSVPASKDNNRIFRHFYNFNVSQGGFDGRVYHESKMLINHLHFKRGRITLNGVLMKNQKVSSYNITFYGNTVTLTDILKEDKLQALDLSAFDHTWNHDNIKDIFQNGLDVNSDSDALIYPLITSKKRLFYDSSLADNSNKNFNGNLYHTTESSPSDPKRYSKRGVTPIDLKPAIKLHHVIKAIEDKYTGINFTSDSFLNSTSVPISNLYMWMSNRSGNIFGEDALYRYVFNNYSLKSGSVDLANVSVEDKAIKLNIVHGLSGDFFRWTVIVRVNDVLNVDTEYTVSIRSLINGSVKKQTYSGDRDIYFEVTGESSFNEFTVELASKELTSYNVEVDIRYWEVYNNSQIRIETYEVNNGSDITVVQDLAIKDNLPDIKIIDLLTGLFKLFNLTAYFIDDEYSADFGKIRVLPLDDYYADALNNQSGGIIDITDYIDVTEHIVDTSFPFSDIDFKYSETETLLIKQHNDEFGRIFGNSNLPVSSQYQNLVTRKPYEIKVPFGHLKYERIRNGANDSQTEIQWGYAASGDFNSKNKSPYENYNSETADHKPPEGDYSSVNIKPLLFYGIQQTSMIEKINFSSIDLIQSAAIDKYFMPSNSKEDSANVIIPTTVSLNFDAEVDEFTQVDSGSLTNSLFNKFYKKYIRSVFEPSKRMFIFTAYFPPSFLIKYKLNDQLKVQDVVYRINSISTELNTGKSKLELINLNADEIIE